MKEKKQNYIKCPNCGREYLPAEIYIPNAFFGKPEDIEREFGTGRILHYIGKNMDTVEHYVCDACNTAFKVVAKVQFSTYVEDKYDFDKDYSVKINKQGLFLSEE
jgi:uncharacterized OB-fold protein